MLAYASIAPSESEKQKRCRLNGNKLSDIGLFTPNESESDKMRYIAILANAKATSRSLSHGVNEPLQ